MACRIIHVRNAFWRKPLSVYSKGVHTAQAQLSENDVEEVRIPVPWGHVAGKWWGNKNEIPILGIHGWQDNANSFDALVPKLNVSSFLAIDAPGHGISSYLPPGRIYSFLEYIFVIKRIVNYFKWKKFSVLGHSLGGVIAYAYSSIYPEDVECLISVECARSLVMMHTLDLANSFSSGIDKLLKIESQLKETSPPSYKLSDMVQMYCEGSMGSINPSSALVLLKRGAHPVEELKNGNTVTRQSYTDLIDFVQLEKIQSAKKIGSRDSKLQSIVAENQKKIKKNLQSFLLSEADNKLHIFTRDPRIKVNVFGLFNEELLKECAKKIKCPVLSLRAEEGFLHGASSPTYESTINILKQNSRHFEHHEVKGTHHTHLNTPEHIAPVINNFLKNVKL